MRKLALVTALALTSVAFPALALDSFNTFWLTRAVTAGKIHDHMERLDRIADRNDGTRSLGTPGNAASVRFVVDRLKRAHYKSRSSRSSPTCSRNTPRPSSSASRPTRRSMTTRSTS